MASFICAMPSEDLSLKKVWSEELYVDLKKWLVFPRIRRHRFGSQISAMSKNLVAFSTSGISLPANSLFFFNSSKIILLGGLNFSSLLARGSHGLADDYDGLHCLDCVTFPGSLLGCSQQDPSM
ncbi:hypothetical protein OUZ56_026377 [Daphnia magna]|uniref:Uncharacterized protein n=1 Tax=Daphnia magna TaxID=35525 RepID=A0ABQ9ZMY0_9CRUS|nr:hypothetical protein OUZ56_026377 [Daphnia magna]